MDCEFNPQGGTFALQTNNSEIITMTEITKPAITLTKAGMGLSDGLPLQASDGGIDELRRDVQRMMDIEAIKQLKHRYFRCIDTANWEELEPGLHADMKTHYMGGGYEFKLASRAEFLATMEQAFHSEAVGRNNGSRPEIDRLSDTEATGIWYLYDHFWSMNNDSLTHGTALYWDRYVKEDGRWQIKETTYQRIYQINEKLSEKPALAAHYLSEHGYKHK